ncbi:hypothetical protein AVHM3334_11935 [Acidovorax sp. SUPP3334]|nr:hypothetical protein AVHM3334_11935 [Acidovorax sp. SUPP3334]
MSPFIGGGFGGKLFLRADTVLAALGARAAGRPVKVAMQRPLMANNGTHRPATMQRIRIGAGKDGRITAIGHESWSGNLPGGDPEDAIAQTRLLYAGAHRYTALRISQLDLTEDELARLRGPIGLFIGSKTPAEIAVSVMAEVLSVRNGVAIPRQMQVAPAKETLAG